MKNRKILNIISMPIVVVMSMMLMACHPSPNPDPPTLNLDKNYVSFSADGGTDIVRVTSNTTWDVSGANSWLSVSKSENMITIVAQKNESSEKRIANLIVKTSDGQLSQTITVSIEPVTMPKITLKVSPTEISLLSSANSSSTFTITTDGEWTAQLSVDWLNLSSVRGNGNSTITVTALTENKSSSHRQATIVIRSGEENEIVKISQLPAYIDAKVEMVQSSLVVLNSSLACGYNYTNNVAYFYGMCIPQSESAKYTDDYVVDHLKKNGLALKPETGDVLILNELYPGIDYYLFIVAFDNQDQRGQLLKYEIKTPKDDVYNSPYISNKSVSITYEMDENDKLYYRVKASKDAEYSAYADKFYIWVAFGTYDFISLYYWSEKNYALMAYILKQEIKNNPSPHDTYINSTDRSMVRERIEGPVSEASFLMPANYGNDKYIHVINWCTLPNGNMSGTINGSIFSISPIDNAIRSNKQEDVKSSLGSKQKVTIVNTKRIRDGFKLFNLK